MSNINKKYYVYIYLDPTKLGQHLYNEYLFEYEPFYVGYGHNNRKNDHIKEAKTNKKSYKLNKIRKIISDGLSPIIITYQENLSENDAKNLEIKLIKSIGRKDLKLGPLTNLTSGGDGSSGFIPSQELRELWSKIRTGTKNGMYNKKHSNESKEKESNTRKEKIKNGEIVPTKHTQEWKQKLKDKFAINDNLILNLNSNGKSATEIGKIINKSSVAVRRRLAKYNIKYKRNKEVNIDRIHELIKNNLSYAEIGKIFKVSESCIGRNYRKSKYYI